MSRRRGVAGAQTLLRTGYGLAQVLVPGRLGAVVLRLHRPPGPPLTHVARVLGARHLAQALPCAVWPRRGVLQAGVAVDGLHAASMVALAVASPRWRRAALAETCLAVIFTALGVKAAAEAADLEAAPRWPSAR